MHTQIHPQKLPERASVHTHTYSQKALSGVLRERGLSARLRLYSHDQSRFGARNNPIKMLECLDVKWLTESFRARHKYWFAVMPRISARTAHTRRDALSLQAPTALARKILFASALEMTHSLVRFRRTVCASDTDKRSLRCEMWGDCRRKCRGCFTIDARHESLTSAEQSKYKVCLLVDKSEVRGKSPLHMQ